jgi:hypothetical protein
MLAIAATALIGFIVPALILRLMYPDDTGDGPPGPGLMIICTTAFAAAVSLFSLVAGTSLIYRRLSPNDEKPSN